MRLFNGVSCLLGLSQCDPSPYESIPWLNWETRIAWAMRDHTSPSSLIEQENFVNVFKKFSKR